MKALEYIENINRYTNDDYIINQLCMLRMAVLEMSIEQPTNELCAELAFSLVEEKFQRDPPPVPWTPSYKK